MATMLGKLTTIMGPARGPAEPAPVRRDRFFLEPPYPTIYAIGDVHGSLADLLAAEDLILADGAGLREDKLILYLGDVVDRGPRSADVLDHLLSPAPPGFARLCLCGNHEEAMLSFLQRPLPGHPWLAMGGEATLASYGLTRAMLFRGTAPDKASELLDRVIPSDHVGLLKSLPVLLEGPGVVFVHAGIQPGVPLHEQSEADLLWIREPFLSAGPGLPILVVHGHTPHSLPSIGRLRLGIDTLAATGVLTVVRWRDGRLTILTGPDRAEPRLPHHPRRQLSSNLRR